MGQSAEQVYETVEELYSGQDVIAASMTKQLEEANTKAEFSQISAESCGLNILHSLPLCIFPRVQ